MQSLARSGSTISSFARVPRSQLRSRLRRPAQAGRRMASTVRNVTFRLGLSERKCSRVAAEG